MAPSWTHLVRFIAEEDGQVHLGQVDETKFPDVGIAMLNNKEVTVKEIKGSIFDGVVQDRVLNVAQVLLKQTSFCKTNIDQSFLLFQILAPVSIDEVPIIRCMGLNYRDHALEANMPIPDVPVLFIKPRTALNGPYPAKINVPIIAQDGTSDYEAELTFILSKSGKDIPEGDAMDYVLGYTCSNDVSARAQQCKNSQWSFAKGAF